MGQISRQGKQEDVGNGMDSLPGKTETAEVKKALKKKETENDR